VPLVVNLYTIYLVEGIFSDEKKRDDFFADLFRNFF
jgi:hypothetical protein